MRIYKHGQIMGTIRNGELKITHINLKIAMRDYREPEDLIEFLEKKGFKITPGG